MGKINHTGHPINVANLDKLIAYLIELGEEYDPVLLRIKIVNLKLLLTLAQGKMQTLKDAFNAFERATNDREIEYSDVKKLSTRLINALIASGANKLTIADARTINRKIQGGRAAEITKATPPVNPPVLTSTEQIANNNSVSQLNVEYVFDNFVKLVTFLSNEPLYMPNEVDLQLDTLQTKVDNLKLTNAAVLQVTPPYEKAMYARDVVLYTEETGLVDTTKLVKSYCLSVLHSTNATYKKIKAIPFRNL